MNNYNKQQIKIKNNVKRIKKALVFDVKYSFSYKLARLHYWEHKFIEGQKNFRPIH